MDLIDHRRRAALVGLIALLAASCGGSDDEASSDSTNPVTAPQTSSAATAESDGPTATAAVTTAPAPSMTLSPGDFAVQVPTVEGYSYGVTPASPIPWPQLGLPDDVEGFAFDVRASGASIGSILILDDFGLDRYVDASIDEAVQIELGTTDVDGETLIVTNGVRSAWRPIGGVPVVAATLPEGDVGQWVWGHDGLVWIAVGTLAMDGYVTGLVASQQEAVPADAHDYGLLAGPLYGDWLSQVPGCVFVDLPVAAALEQIPDTLSGDCAKRLYVGHVVPADDPDPLTMAPDDLALVAATIGGDCTDDGFFDALDTTLDGMSMRDDVIGGVPVRRNETDIVAIDGNDVLHVSSSDPATLVEMAPFTTALVSRQRQPEVVDFTTLAVGTCLFNGAPRDADPLDRPSYVTDCAAPHHGEMIHSYALDEPSDATYPGDTAVSTLADQGCVDAFAGYVGIDFASSRLSLLYLYPSPQSWAEGDRSVLCIVEGSTPDELLRGSTAQSEQ